VQQGELIQELVEVDIFIAIVVEQDVQGVDDISLGEMQLLVERVEKKRDGSDIHRPQRVAFQNPQQL